MSFFHPYNFAGVAKEDYPLEECRFVVLPVCYDLTASYRPGARRGPLAILEASTFMEMYDDELGYEIIDEGIYTMPPVEQLAGNPEEFSRIIQEEVEKILQNKKIPVVIGGEHSISIGVGRAIRKHFKDLTVLHLDAHADLREEYQNSNYNHACAVYEMAQNSKIVQAGIRSLTKDEHEIIKTNKNITTFFARDIAENENWQDKVVNHLDGNIFITIDLDCFDPSIIPSTGTPEPGGLFYYEVLSLLKKVTEKCNVVGFDVVELSPIPGMVAPDYLVAKLIYKLIGYISR